MSAALLVIDMLNPYDHEDAEPLMKSISSMLPSLRELLERTREAMMEANMRAQVTASMEETLDTAGA